jgi:hypothetical protein
MRRPLIGEKIFNTFIRQGEQVVHGKKKLCVNKEHGRKLCVGSNCSEVHGKISMNKPLDSCLK